MNAISADIISSIFPLSGKIQGPQGALEYMDKHYFAHVKTHEAE